MYKLRFTTFLLIFVGAFTMLNAQIFTDDCEDYILSNSKWTRSGDTTKIYNYDAGGNAHSGSNVWRANTPYSVNLISDTINISAQPNPHISFWYKGVSGGGYITFQVSTDGGVNWISLGGTTTCNVSWTKKQLNLLDYKSNNFMFKFSITDYCGGYTYIDDIIMDNAPIPRSVSLSQATNNGMKISWGQSTASDFKHYRIQVSTSLGSISYYRPEQDYHIVSAYEEIWVKTITNKGLLSLIFHRDSTYFLTFPNRTYYVTIFEEDILDFYNQGTEQVNLATAFTGTVHTAPTTVNFDSSPLPDWPCAVPWRITNEEDGQTGHSSPNSWSDSPIENYTINSQKSLYSIWKIGTSVSKPVLKFKQKYNFNTGDAGTLSWSLDNSNWYIIDNYVGSSNYGEWEEREYFIGELKQVSASTPVYLKYHLGSDGSTANDGWYIDNVGITQNPRSEITFPLSIDMEDSLAVANTFVLGGGSWENVGGNAHSGEHVLKVNGPYGNYIYLGQSMNIATKPNPHISFWYRGINGGGYINFQVSTDGGMNWITVVGFFACNVSWTKKQITLLNYKSNNFMFRFNITDYCGGSTYIDDIIVDNAPPPRSVSLSHATNNGMKISWGQSASNYFKHYRLQVSTYLGYINYYRPEEDYHSVSANEEIWVKTITDKDLLSLTFNRDSAYFLTFPNRTYYVTMFEEDTLDFYNQGTEQVNLATAFTGTVHIAPTTVDFDSNPLPEWPCAVPWRITNEENGQAGHSSPNSWSDSPIDNYSHNSQRSLYSIWKIGLSVTKPVLKFKQKHNFNTGDGGSLSWSLDNSNWNVIDNYVGASNFGEWEEREYFLGELKQVSASTPVYLKYHVGSDGSTANDGWYIDDVSISQNTRSEIIFPTSIDMEDSLEVANKLVLGGARWENVGGNAHSGEHVLKVNSPFGNYIYIGQSMNIMSKPNPYISFWYRGMNGGGYIHFQVSANGGLNWTTVNGYYTCNVGWTKGQINLLNYKSNNFMFRFNITDYCGGYTYIDDIFMGEMISLSSPINSVTNVNRINLPFYWTNSSTSSKYHFQLSRQSNFSTLDKEDTTLVVPYKVVDTLLENTTYYWRVSGLNEETDWTPAWSFVTKSGASTYQMSVPVIVNPTSGTTGVDTALTQFRWRKVDSAVTYKLQVSLSLSFDSFAINQIISDTSFVVNNLLASGTTYYWRVRAHRPSDTSMYSYPAAFATIGIGGGPLLPEKIIKTKQVLHGLWSLSKHLPANVTLELRSGSTLSGSTLAKRIPAIIDSLGWAKADFGELANGDYWLVVRTPGYLPVAKPTQITLSNTETTFDFTTSSAQTVGTINAMIQPDITSPWMIRAGDFNNSRSVTATDLNLYFLQSNGKTVSNLIPAP